MALGRRVGLAFWGVGGVGGRQKYPCTGNFQVLGFRVLGFRVLGFRVLGIWGFRL